MRLHRKILLLATTYVLYSNALLYGQSFAEDLEKVKNSFNGSAPLKINVEVKYFKYEKDSKASIVRMGLIKRWGATYYHSNFDGKEYLINKKYTVFVDNGKKLILIKNAAPIAKQNQQLSIPEINQEEEKKYNIQRVVSGDKVSYTLVSKTNKDSGFKMELDKGGSRLTRIIYLGGNSYSRTEISYKYNENEVTLTAADFSESKFVTKQQKTFMPVAKYAGYEINDQTR